MTSLLVLLTVLSTHPADPPRPVETTPLGRRVTLRDDAHLFVPRGFQPAPDKPVDLLVHLHGAASVVEPAMIEASWPGVLLVFNRKGLSSVYTKPFSDPGLLSRLIDDTLAALRELGVSPDPKPGRLVVSSFSAGFGGVRAMLKDPALGARIDGLVLADSLYCGYRGDPARHEVDPDLMSGFRAFAISAAAGQKAILLSHSSQVPGSYASTTETADDLIRATGAASQATSRSWAEGWTQTREAVKGRFLVLGFHGGEAADHMNHLRQIAKLWRRYRELAGTTSPKSNEGTH